MKKRVVVTLTIGLLAMSLGLVGLGFLAVACGGDSTEQRASLPMGAPELQQAGAVAATHAMTMRQHGEWMIQQGRSGLGDRWVTEGNHLLAHAQELVNLNQSISLTAQSLATNAVSDRGNGMDLRKLKGDGLAIQQQGRAMVLHAQTMKDHAAFMKEEMKTSSDPAVVQAVTFLNEDADLLAEMGDQLVAVGTSVATRADNLARSLSIKID